MIIKVLTLLLIAFTLVIAFEVKKSLSYAHTISRFSVKQAMRSVRFEAGFPLIVIINSVLVLLILIYNI